MLVGDHRDVITERKMSFKACRAICVIKGPIGKISDQVSKIDRVPGRRMNEVCEEYAVLDIRMLCRPVGSTR